MDGILIVDKPQGMTSHDVVSFIRKKFSLKKAGHAGTLDPMATGVLIILLGKATKSSGLLISDDKEYQANMTLGAVSDTGDIWGRIEYSPGLLNLTEDKIRSVFKKFLGVTEQTPPMYSAVKVKGRKLYELARKGLSVKVEPRKINIKSLTISGIKLPEVAFNLVCSKGTYVRQLCVDIGIELGCGACLSGLRRTRSGRFSIEEAVNFENLRAIKDKELSDFLFKI